MVKTEPKIVIAGRNIYLDQNGQTILFEPRTNRAYILRQKDAKDFKLYQNRYMITLAAFVLSFTFFKAIWIAPIIAILIFGVLEYRYRKKFLASLPLATHFRPKKQRTTLDGYIEANDPKRCLMLACLYGLFGILLVVNGIMEKHAIYLLAFEVIVLGYCGYMALTLFQAYSKIKKTSK